MSLNLNTFNFTGKDIVFLLGAGASVDAGVDSLAQIMIEVENVFLENDKKGNPDKLLKQIEEVYFYFKKNSIKPDHLKENNIQFGAYNIEDILSNIRNIIDERDSPNKSSYTSIDRRLLEIIKDDYSVLEKAYARLSGIVIRRIIEQTKKCDSRIDYFFSLFFLAEELDESINIFTLNFDLVFECAYKKYKKLTDKTGKLLETGFRDGNIFRPENLKYDVSGQRIYYHKLHGSLNWKMDEEDVHNRDKIIEIDEEEMEGLVRDDVKLTDQIIFGTSRKYRSEAPYTFLYGNFVQALGSAKILIVVGYSYTDVHINDALRNALNYNENLYILNVAPNFKDTTRSWLKERSGNSVRISPDKNGLAITEYADYLHRVLDNKEYYDTFYALKMYTYSRNFDEDALYLSRIYHYYLDKADKERQYILEDLGAGFLTGEKRSILDAYINKIGSAIDKVLTRPIPANLKRIWEVWNEKPYSNQNVEFLIKRLKEISIQVYGVVLNSTSSDERQVLTEFSNKIKIILFFFSKFFPKFISRYIDNRKLYNTLLQEHASEQKLFLLRLRMIEQLILAYYLVEYVKIGHFNETLGKKYASLFNIDVNEINKLVEQTYFHVPSKEIVELLKYESALKVSGSLPGGKQLSRFNRQTIRIVGETEKKNQTILRLRTKSALSAFIDKNSYLRFLVDLSRSGTLHIYTSQSDWPDEIAEDAKTIFNNKFNNFSDDDLIELVMKMNSNLFVYNKIFNQINEKTLDQFLNSNLEQKRIGRNFFKEKIKYKKEDNFQLRKSTAEYFFTNELRLRNLFKYYHNYFLTTHF